MYGYLLSGTFCEFYKASKGGEDVVIKLVSFFNLSVRYEHYQIHF